MGYMPRIVPPVVPAGRMRETEQPVLTAGGGLTIRPWRPGDAPALQQAYAVPDIRRWHRRSADTLAEAAALVTAWRRGWPDETAGQWAVTGPDGELAGRLSLRVELELGAGEIGYWVLPAARGAGVAARSVTCLTAWAFGELGLHRIELGHATANEASCKVAATCGYRLEGQLRSALLHEDGWHDMHLHARIADDRAPGG
jgi:RimJ/RimL family protein N-acetyltransferase